MQLPLHPLRSSEEQMATYEGKYKRTVQIVSLPCQVLSLLKMLNDRIWMMVLFPLFWSSILNLHLRTLRNLFLLILLRLLPGYAHYETGQVILTTCLSQQSRAFHIKRGKSGDIARGKRIQSFKSPCLPNITFSFVLRS